MLFPHVVDFQSTEAANGQGFFQCQTGMVCMDMDLDDLIIADTNNGIPNGTQIGFQLLHSGVIGIFHIDEKILCQYPKVMLSLSTEASAAYSFAVCWVGSAPAKLLQN